MKELMIVSGSMNRGGAERVISILSNELVKRGWKVMILTILSEGCGYELDSQIELVNISRNGQNQVLSIPRLAKEIRKKINEKKPIAVISFMIAVNIVVWIATRGLNVRFIPSERNDPSTGRNAIFRLFQYIVYNHSSATVFQTERAKSFFPKRIQKKGVVIPNPITVNAYTKNDKTKKIVSIGRLESQKNQELLIRAFSSIHKVYQEYKLEIYGEGTLRKKLQQLIESLHLSGFVKLKGNYNNVHEQIADAELFVLSSNYEGQSNALLEAMMMGLPCISTNCAGSDEAIEDGINGMIVPVNDQTAMEKAICKLIEDPIKAELLGKEASASMQRYQVKSVVDRWEELLI